MAVIPPVVQRPRLIFDFTWIGLNEDTAQEAPEEVISFGGTLLRIIQWLLMANPRPQEIAEQV